MLTHAQKKQNSDSQPGGPVARASVEPIQMNPIRGRRRPPGSEEDPGEMIEMQEMGGEEAWQDEDTALSPEELEAIASDPESGMVSGILDDQILRPEQVLGKKEKVKKGFGKAKLKIKSGFKKAKAKASSALTDARAAGDGSVLRGGFRKARDKVKQVARPFRAAKGGKAKAKVVGKAAGKGLTKLATGQSVGELKKGWTNAKGKRGKAAMVGKVAANTAGRVLKKTPVGKAVNIGKSALKTGKGVAGAVASGMAYRKAGKSTDQAVKAVGQGVAKGQGMQAGVKAGAGALSLTGQIAELASGPQPLTHAGTVGTGLEKVGGMALDDTQPTMDYLTEDMSLAGGTTTGKYQNWGQLAGREMDRAKGWTQKTEGQGFRREARHNPSATEDARLQRLADFRDAEAQSAAQAIDEGRTVLKPSEVKKQAKALEARKKLVAGLRGTGALDKMETAQSLLS